MDVFERIKEERDNLSNSFGKVADFICGNYEEVAFMSIGEVAKLADVSESVVVRFAASLGYSGFSEMKKNIERKVKKNLMMPNRMMAANISEESSYNEIMAASLNTDMNNILSTLKDPYNKSFESIVKELKEANRIYVIGTRGLFKVAGLTEFLFNLLGFDCVSINAGDSAQVQKLRLLNKHCVVLALSLPRYDRHINSILRMAKKARAKTIVLSDNAFSPDAKIADLSMSATVASHTFINSYCALIALINAIVAAVGVKYKEETMKALCEVEECLENFNLEENYSDQLDQYTENQEE